MLIIEGPDGSGKSTLVNQLKSMGNKITKPYYPKSDQISFYLHSAPHYRGLILERYYLSELIYPKIKQNRAMMPDWYQFIMEAGMLPLNPVILYVRPDNENIKNNILTRGDDYISESEIDKMIELYDSTIEKSHLPILKYNYKKHDPESVMQSVYFKMKENEGYTSATRHYLSSGLSSAGVTMIIGENPSNTSIGQGYIRAFISHKGSSEFLHKCLYEAGVYDKEMPYFTNWDKGQDNDEDRKKALLNEISILKPKKIICLGKNVHSKFPEGEFLEHPSYVKRFSPRNKNESYIDKIKKLFNL